MPTDGLKVAGFRIGAIESSNQNQIDQILFIP